MRRDHNGEQGAREAPGAAAVDERIRDLFATLLQVSREQVRDDTSPGDLARWDSVQHLIAVAGFEEEFGIDLDPEEAVEMYKDFATFKRIVRERLGAGE